MTFSPHTSFSFQVPPSSLLSISLTLLVFPWLLVSRDGGWGVSILGLCLSAQHWMQPHAEQWKMQSHPSTLWLESFPGLPLLSFHRRGLALGHRLAVLWCPSSILWDRPCPGCGLALLLCEYIVLPPASLTSLAPYHFSFPCLIPPKDSPYLGPSSESFSSPTCLSSLS